MNYDQQSQIMTLSMWTVKNTMFCCCSCWKCGLENGFIYSLIKKTSYLGKNDSSRIVTQCQINFTARNQNASTHATIRFIYV